MTFLPLLPPKTGTKDRNVVVVLVQVYKGLWRGTVVAVSIPGCICFMYFPSLHA